MVMKDEYIIINKTAIENRIAELEEIKSFLILILIVEIDNLQLIIYD